MRSPKVMRAGTGNKKFFIWPNAYAMLKIAYLKRAYIWLKIHGFIQFPFEMAQGRKNFESNQSNYVDCGHFGYEVLYRAKFCRAKVKNFGASDENFALHITMNVLALTKLLYNKIYSTLGQK